MTQRPMAPDKHGKVFFGSTFRVLESPHASPCLSFASPSAGYAFNPVPAMPMSFGELPPSMAGAHLPTGHVPGGRVPTSGHVPTSGSPQIRPGGSVLDLIPTSPTWTAMQRPDTENIGLTRQRSGSPGPDPSTTQNARPRPMPLQHVVTAAVTTALPLGQVSPVGQCPPSPAFTRQISPPGSPAFTRQFSPPGSPAWTTVSNQKRKPGPGGAPVVRTGPAVPQEPVLQRLHTTGDSVDMYYDQKEMFTKGWTKEAKGTRSVKQKKRVDYQVEKRRQQSARDRGFVEDDFDDFLLDAE